MMRLVCRRDAIITARSDTIIIKFLDRKKASVSATQTGTFKNPSSRAFVFCMIFQPPFIEFLGGSESKLPTGDPKFRRLWGNPLTRLSLAGSWKITRAKSASADRRDFRCSRRVAVTYFRSNLAKETAATSVAVRSATAAHCAEHTGLQRYFKRHSRGKVSAASRGPPDRPGTKRNPLYLRFWPCIVADLRFIACMSSDVLSETARRSRKRPRRIIAHTEMARHRAGTGKTSAGLRRRHSNRQFMKHMEKFHR